MGTVTAGLEGVIAGESEICYIDGYQGILSYRGYNIHTLADNAVFEEVIFLLWNGSLPKQAELDQLRHDLVSERPLPSAITEFLRGVSKVNTMDMLRTAVSMLSLHDPEAQDMSPEANRRKAVRLMAKTATIVTTYDRLRKGQPVIEGDPSLHFAANFLYTLTGKKPDDVMEHAFDVALTLHADHELNASTFAGRVAAATLTDIYSAVVAAIGTLKGPLHGGANAEVMKMLIDLGETATGDRIDEFVKGKFARKEKISGFGHRVYKTEDPRATHLRQMSRDLGQRVGQPIWYEMSQRIEQLVKAEKKLNANVDFYSASTYYALGIPLELYTPIFAVSRISGWTAHVLEQYANNRLIRPRADYIGPEYPQRYVPIESR